MKSWFSKPHARLICLGRYLYFGLVVVWISVSDEALLGQLFVQVGSDRQRVVIVLLGLDYLFR
jgi:hypothetical protein